MLHTDPARSVCTASVKCVSSSLVNRSPAAARQSSTEVSGLAGLNTSDVCRLKPVVAANTKMQDRVRPQTGSADYLQELFTSKKGREVNQGQYQN